MEHDRFRHPVSIFVGLGFPAEIHGVSEAYTWLNEWPPSKRNPTHAIALNACKAALAGEIDAETARTALVACARRANLLAPDTGTIVGANRPTQSTLYRRPVAAKGSFARGGEIVPYAIGRGTLSDRDNFTR